MRYVSTDIPRVYATPSTLQLVNQFLSCPAARKLIFSDAIFKPLYIQKTKKNLAYTNLLRKTDGKLFMKIAIPERNGVADLIFEIFNAKIDSLNSKLNRVKETESGDISMDQFARGNAIYELNFAREHDALSNECKMLNLPHSILNDYIKQGVPTEGILFMQDIECHLDFYRVNWIDRYQKNYCSKHPNDTSSCTTKKSDLCNRNTAFTLPKDEWEKLIKDRICKKFPQAHETGKRLYEEFFKANCASKKSIHKDDL